MKSNTLIHIIQKKLRKLQTYTELGYSSSNREIYNARKFRLIQDGVIGTKILDVACGIGEITNKIIGNGRQVSAIDINKEYLNKIKDKRIKKYCMSAEKLDFPDNTFDCVIVAGIIEHIHHPHDALSEWTRVLKPGGKLIITTPNAFMGLLKKGIGGNPFHIKEFGYFELKKLLSKNYKITKSHKHFLLSLDIPYYKFIAPLYRIITPHFMTLYIHLECLKR